MAQILPTIDSTTLIAIISTFIAFCALIWAIYAHMSSRKRAKLTYSISQFSDFGVPESFIAGMVHSPLAIKITSRGNKATENIVLRIKTKSIIDDYEIWPADSSVNHVENTIVLKLDKLNPSQVVRLFIRCKGSPQMNQVDSFDLSHSEGSAIDEKQISTITLNIFGIKLEYDPMKLATHIVKIGPISFR